MHWGLSHLSSQPEAIRGEVFDELFEDIEINRLTPEDMEQYGKSGIRFADYPIFTAYGKEEGIIEGKERGIIEGEKRGILKRNQQISKKLLKMGFSIQDISKITGLTLTQIQKLNV